MAQRAAEALEIAIGGSRGEELRIEQTVDEALQREAGLMNARQIRSELGNAMARGVLHEDLGEADDGADRPAEVLADVGEQGTLEPLVGARFGERCDGHGATLRPAIGRRKPQAFLRPSMVAILSSRRGSSI